MTRIADLDGTKRRLAYDAKVCWRDRQRTFLRDETSAEGSTQPVDLMQSGASLVEGGRMRCNRSGYTPQAIEGRSGVRGGCALVKE